MAALFSWDGLKNFFLLDQKLPPVSCELPRDPLSVKIQSIIAPLLSSISCPIEKWNAIQITRNVVSTSIQGKSFEILEVSAKCLKFCDTPLEFANCLKLIQNEFVKSSKKNLKRIAVLDYKEKNLFETVVKMKELLHFLKDVPEKFLESFDQNEQSLKNLAHFFKVLPNFEKQFHQVLWEQLPLKSLSSKYSVEILRALIKTHKDLKYHDRRRFRELVPYLLQQLEVHPQPENIIHCIQLLGSTIERHRNKKRLSLFIENLAESTLCGLLAENSFYSLIDENDAFENISSLEVSILLVQKYLCEEKRGKALFVCLNFHPDTVNWLYELGENFPRLFEERLCFEDSFSTLFQLVEQERLFMEQNDKKRASWNVCFQEVLSNENLPIFKCFWSFCVEQSVGGYAYSSLRKIEALCTSLSLEEVERLHFLVQNHVNKAFKMGRKLADVLLFLHHIPDKKREEMLEKAESFLDEECLSKKALSTVVSCLTESGRLKKNYKKMAPIFESLDLWKVIEDFEHFEKKAELTKIEKYAKTLRPLVSLLQFQPIKGRVFHEIVKNGEKFIAELVSHLKILEKDIHSKGFLGVAASHLVLSYKNECQSLEKLRGILMRFYETCSFSIFLREEEYWEFIKLLHGFSLEKIHRIYDGFEDQKKCFLDLKEYLNELGTPDAILFYLQKLTKGYYFVGKEQLYFYVVRYKIEKKGEETSLSGCKMKTLIFDYLSQNTHQETVQIVAQGVIEHFNEMWDFPPHELILKAVEIVSAVQTGLNQQNPYQLFAFLKKEALIESPHINAPYFLVGQKVLKFIPEAFRQYDSLVSAVNMKEFPKEALKKWNDLIKDLSKRLSEHPRIANEVLEFTGFDWDNIKENLSHPFFERLILGQEPDHLATAFFCAIFVHLMQLPSKRKEIKSFSKQEEQLLRISACIRNCEVGKREGINLMYRNLARNPVGFREMSFEEGNLEILVWQAFQLLWSEILDPESQYVMNQVIGISDNHNSLFLKNRLGPHIALGCKVVFDLNSELISEKLVNMSLKQLLTTFWNEVSKPEAIEFLRNFFNNHPQKILFANQYFEIFKDPSIWDEEGENVVVQTSHVLSLLENFGLVKRLEAVELPFI